jgi:hypothetical protein
LRPFTGSARSTRFQSVGALGALLLTLWIHPAEAARTRSFATDSYEAFRKGELVGIGIGDDGRAFLGPEAMEAADPSARTLWVLVPDGNGGVVYATGNSGLVGVRGPGREGEATVLATLFDSEVFALCPDGRGNYFAAGAPVSTITRIRPGSEPHTLFDAPEGVVFALLAGTDGSVYAGTGDRGRLYRVSPDGEGKVIYEAPDFSIRSLAWASNGRIWAGTDPRGLVLQIDPQDGHVRVWFDAAEDEIVGLVPTADGGLLFAANPGAAGGESDDPPAGTRSGEGGKEGRSAGPPALRPALYKMTGDGSVRKVWSCPEELIHALTAGPDGAVWIATSEEAGLYLVTPEGRETLTWRPKESQLLSLCVQGDVLWAGTGGPGRLYRVSSVAGEEGIYTSSPIDAGDQARWGVLRATTVGGSDGIAFETRSGYTDAPDETWSAWSAPRESGPDRMVTSPPGRYLQWRATFRRPGAERARLERVEIASTTANASPRITSLRLSPDEAVFLNADQGRGFTQQLPSGVQIDYSLPGGGGVSVSAEEVPPWIRRLRSLVWDAQDVDGDELEFTLEMRNLGEERWHLLAADLRDRAWTLDQGQLPDGDYEIRLTASDAPANEQSSVLRDARTTPPFRVDTVPPTLDEVRVEADAEGFSIRGVARDAGSPLRRIEASLDGEEFRWLAPDDGLMDGREERFAGRILRSRRAVGEWIVIRAQDAAGNRGLHRAWLEAGGDAGR